MSPFVIIVLVFSSCFSLHLPIKTKRGQVAFRACLLSFTFLECLRRKRIITHRPRKKLLWSSSLINPFLITWFDMVSRRLLDPSPTQINHCCVMDLLPDIVSHLMYLILSPLLRYRGNNAHIFCFSCFYYEK